MKAWDEDHTTAFSISFHKAPASLVHDVAGDIVESALALKKKIYISACSDCKIICGYDLYMCVKLQSINIQTKNNSLQIVL